VSQTHSPTPHMLKTIHAAGQYIYNGVLGGGTNEEKDEEVRRSKLACRSKS